MGINKKQIFLSLYTITILLFVYSKTYCKKAIIIGATSGMGRATAKLIAANGYDVGLVGRRMNLLESLEKEIHATNTNKNTSINTNTSTNTDANTNTNNTSANNKKTYVKTIDVSNHKKASEDLQELITQMGGLDLILISISCYSQLDKEPDITSVEKRVIDVDLVGFWKMARTALDHFENQKHGHLAAISSISGLRGSAHCPAYCGAKAFISKYLEGVRNKFLQQKIPIYVTDIIPGWVDVEHTTFSLIPGTYWVTPLDKAAAQIYDAIKKKKKVAYISKRQKIIALLLAIVPDFIFNAMGEF